MLLVYKFVLRLKLLVFKVQIDFIFLRSFKFGLYLLVASVKQYLKSWEPGFL